MVDLLALDGPTLRNLRSEVLNRTLDAEFLASATTEELTQIRDGFRRRDTEGKLPNFGHVVARYAEQSLVGIANTPDDDVTQLTGAAEPN